MNDSINTAKVSVEGTLDIIFHIIRLKVDISHPETCPCTTSLMEKKKSPNTRTKGWLKTDQAGETQWMSNFNQ